MHSKSQARMASWVVAMGCALSSACAHDAARLETAPALSGAAAVSALPMPSAVPAQPMASATESMEAREPQAPALASLAWEDKALFVEARSGSGWAPWAMLPLRASSQPAARDLSSKEPSFGVDPRADGSRRVEIWCAGAMWAWDGLTLGTAQQLEFGCGASRYRAQIGSTGSGARQAMSALARRRAAAAAVAPAAVPAPAPSVFYEASEPVVHQGVGDEVIQPAQDAALGAQDGSKP
jgi:hypothetical protein